MYADYTNSAMMNERMGTKTNQCWLYQKWPIQSIDAKMSRGKALFGDSMRLAELYKEGTSMRQA
jgi:hypothetical protein